MNEKSFNDWYSHAYPDFDMNDPEWVDHRKIAKCAWQAAIACFIKTFC